MAPTHGLTLAFAFPLLLAGCACVGDRSLDCCTTAPVACGPLAWRVVRDRAELSAALDAARRAGTPVAVEIWASWCRYCRDNRRFIDESPSLRTGFERLVRLQVDISEDEAIARHNDLRDALGVPRDTQPYLALIDGQGVARHELDVSSKYPAGFEDELRARIGALGGAR